MSKITESKNVKLFSDEETTAEQVVNIYTNDPDGLRLSVFHNGEELNLSLENWNSLIELVEVAKSRI